MAKLQTLCNYSTVMHCLLSLVMFLISLVSLLGIQLITRLICLIHLQCPLALVCIVLVRLSLRLLSRPQKSFLTKGGSGLVQAYIGHL